MLRDEVKMAEIEDYSQRLLDQEPDTMQILPQNSDYIIVGTYNAHTDSDSGSKLTSDSRITRRSGSLQILPLVEEDLSTADVPNGTNYGSKHFDCAIVDLHFHPQHDSLLGAATSVGQMRFFDIRKNEHRIDGEPLFYIREIKALNVSPAGKSLELPLITYFEWLDQRSCTDSREKQEMVTVTFAACDSNGYSKIITTTLSLTIGVVEQAQEAAIILNRIEYPIHQQQHDLEAWYLTIIPSTIALPGDKVNSYMLLTGGDDANIIASSYCYHDYINAQIYDNNEPRSIISKQARCFTMKNQHDAGVVSILALPVPFADQPGSPEHSSFDHNHVPLLTGSYDDHIRLFMLDCRLEAQHPRGPGCTMSMNLGGGVWRITLLDHYRHHISMQTYSYVLLICNMYDGAKIVRLTASSSPSMSPSSPREQGSNHIQIQWSMKIEAVFKKGHESMVYAAVAREKKKEGNNNNKGKTWQILTSSFYDRKLCNWEWTDHEAVSGN